MTDEPDLTKRQEQVLRALMAQKLAADIDPTEVGGLADDQLARQLGVSEEEIRHDIQALSELGYIEHRPVESAMEDDWFRQVECDWQWPDGRYGNMTVHFYALAASSPQTGHTNVEASLAAYCSLEHANATPRPTLAAAQQLYEEIVEGAACVCGQCTADSFGAKAIHKLIDAYPDPIAVTDVEDYEEKDR
jgi:predicted ArsR family transcriptional regulator